jgi:hypothetical protein
VTLAWDMIFHSRTGCGNEEFKRAPCSDLEFYVRSMQFGLIGHVRHVTVTASGT